MTTRFDPVRDSVGSPTHRQHALPYDDVSTSPVGHSFTREEHSEMSSRERRPSRSASIASLLNDDRAGPSSGSASHLADISEPQGIAGPAFQQTTAQYRYSRSPPLPSTYARQQQSPVMQSDLGSTIMDSHAMPSPHSRSSFDLRRSTSSHSNTSSNEGSMHNIPTQMPSQRSFRSPSVLQLLNSETPRSHHRDQSIPYSREPPARSRGPSFAGGLSILSPNNESVPHMRSTSSSSNPRYDVAQQSPLQRSAIPSPSQHQAPPRKGPASTPSSYFAVPDLPHRSPEAFRQRIPLPELSSPELTHPSMHLRPLSSGEQEPLRRPFGHGNQSMATQSASLLSSSTPSERPLPLHSPRRTSLSHNHEAPIKQADTGVYASPSTAEWTALPSTPRQFAAETPSPGSSRGSMKIERDPSFTQSPSFNGSSAAQNSAMSPVMDLRGSDPEAEKQIMPPLKRRRETRDDEENGSSDAVPGEVAMAANEMELRDDVTLPKRGRPKGRKNSSKIDPGIATKTPLPTGPVEARGKEMLSEVEPDDQHREVGVAGTTDGSQGTYVERSAERLTMQAPSSASDDKDRSTQAAPTSPATISAPITAHLPHSSASATPAQANLTAAAVRTVYQPTLRVSIPTTMRLPVTSRQVDEMQYQCRNPLRRKWREVNPTLTDGWELMVANFAAQAQVSTMATSSDKKRKHVEDSAADDINAKLVAQHYNSRQDQGLDMRRQSPILPLRNYNNWVKSVIIGMFATRSGRVLDLGGGKGGDLNKWDKAGIGEYVLCDIAEMSVEQAQSRYRERRFRFDAQFFSFDCFSTPLNEKIPRSLLDPLFDNVTLQFCLHYGWESVPKAQLMLENIARYLKPGGTFVGTIPNADLLRTRLTEAIDGQQQDGDTSSASIGRSLNFGNQYYNVRFDPSYSMTKSGNYPPFGHKYYFTLMDAVDDVAEYVVDWDQLLSLAQQNGLQCVYKKTFEQVWFEEGQTGRFNDLSKKMKIYPEGPDGLPMSVDLWEATGLYIAFAFEKKARL